MKAKVNFPRHTSLDHRKTPSVDSHSQADILNNSARKISELVTETVTQNNIVTSNTQTRRSENPGHHVSKTTSQTPNGSTPRNMFVINRKLTRGYLKFLEDKDFIDRREEERHKIEEDLKKIAGENPKIMSKEIQKLISASIVNDPKRPKSVLRVVDPNTFSGQMNSTDEKHKQLCSRILGGEFENTFLFVKVQEESIYNQSNSTQSLKERPREHKPKGSSMSSLKKGPEPRDPKTVKQLLTKNLDTSLAATLINLSKEKKEKDRENKSVSKGLMERTKNNSCSTGPESIQIIDNSTSLNDLDFLQGLHSNTKLENIIEESKNENENSPEKERARLDNEKPSSQGNTKVRLTIKKKSNLRDNLNEIVQSKSVKAMPHLKKVNSPFEFLTVDENNQNKSHGESLHSKVLDQIEKQSLNKINKLSMGVVKQTNKLERKIKRQERKLGRDFAKINMQMERLTYDNTIKNWEKTVKKVENIEQKSTFFNLVL